MEAETENTVKGKKGKKVEAKEADPQNGVDGEQQNSNKPVKKYKKVDLQKYVVDPTRSQKPAS